MGNSIFVHSSSIVEEGAQIGDGTKIWHFSHVMPTAIIGINCNIGQNVYIDKEVTIGHGVKIQNNVSIYKGVILENDVFIGPSVVFTNVLNPRSFVERKHEFRSTLIRNGATIGANATLVCGVEIGQYAMIGAGAVITSNIKPYALVVGNPARQIGWVSKAGNRLNFEGEIEICEDGWVYQLDGENLKVNQASF